MSNIVTNPEDLGKVAKAIQTAAQEIDNAISRMNNALNSAQWNDPVRKKFDRDIESLVNKLKNFKINADPVAKQIKGRQRLLDAYLKRR